MSKEPSLVSRRHTLDLPFGYQALTPKVYGFCHAHDFLLSPIAPDFSYSEQVRRGVQIFDLYTFGDAKRSDGEQIEDLYTNALALVRVPSPLVTQSEALPTNLTAYADRFVREKLCLL